jgi:hypothetical protein
VKARLILALSLAGSYLRQYLFPRIPSIEEQLNEEREAHERNS